MCRWHQLNCEIDVCECKQMKFDVLMRVKVEYTEEEESAIERNWYSFVSDVIEQLIHTTSKPSQLYLY